MNKSVFFAEGLKFFDISIKEKLNEYDAPPWSPNIDKLSPIKKSITPNCDIFESCTEIEHFNTCKLEFKPQKRTEEESTPELTLEKTAKASLPPTPKVRKPISVIMSRIRRIDFDLPEDFELEMKSKKLDNNESDMVNETIV